jgi:biopolymer transport protein ExbD/biopolymer transport protein TolR
MAYKPQAGAQMASPNVIPMADIMLVLLIIFMVVTPMLQKGVSVDLANVNNPHDMKDADKDDAIVVAVTRDGKIYLGNTPDRRHHLPVRIARHSSRPYRLRQERRGPNMATSLPSSTIRSAGVVTHSSPRRTRRTKQLLPRLRRTDL